MTSTAASSRNQTAERKRKKTAKLTRHQNFAFSTSLNVGASVCVTSWLSSSPFNATGAGGADVNVSSRGRWLSSQTWLLWALAMFRSIPLGFSLVRFRRCELELLCASSSNPLNSTQRSELYSSGTCFFWLKRRMSVWAVTSPSTVTIAGQQHFWPSSLTLN